MALPLILPLCLNSLSTKCDEDDEEQPQIKLEEFTKLRCHISVETNHLSDGLKAVLFELHVLQLSKTLIRH